jgi:hypothetical protein
MRIRFPSAIFDAVPDVRKKSTNVRVLDSIHPSVEVWNVNESMEKVGVGATGTILIHLWEPEA